MKYQSTRGASPVLNFNDAVLTGLAPDGGLYVPQHTPVVTKEQLDRWRHLSYAELAVEVMWPFVGDDIPRTDFERIVPASYRSFRHSEVAPLVELGENTFVLELFHGPTLAFKDFALQFLGNLVDYLLEKRNARAVVLGATSGDTGSAAIEGCRHCKQLDIFILHPQGRISEVQRRQMTTVLSPNVHNLAVEGNFDDCQNIVKASFNDQSFLPSSTSLMAVNSINWARILAQVVYYFYSAFRLPQNPYGPTFVVPTGNFGDIYAGYIAQKMGLPIKRLVVATNANDILHRCLAANDYSRKPLKQTESPSMDIMVSSNFERLLFDLYDEDGAEVRALMESFQDGHLTLKRKPLEALRSLFSSHAVNDEQTLETIARVHQECGYLLDPHTAIGVKAAESERMNARARGDSVDDVMVCLGTAHPFKFMDAVHKVLPSAEPELPEHMKGLNEREERVLTVENSASAVQHLVREHLTH